jgi:hypothetical protein
MCVLLCANHAVQCWSTLAACQSERQVLQAVKTCHGNAATSKEIEQDEPTGSDETYRESTTQAFVRVRILPGRLLNRVPSGPHMEIWYSNPPRASLLDEWKHPLDALANAWDRLLAFVGWRR